MYTSIEALDGFDSRYDSMNTLYSRIAIIFFQAAPMNERCMLFAVYILHSDAANM